MKLQPAMLPWKTVRDLGAIVLLYAVMFLPLREAFWGLSEFMVGFFAGLALILLGCALGVFSYVSRRTEATPDVDIPSAASAVDNGQAVS